MTDEPRYGERAAVPPTPITSAPSQRRGGWRPSPIFVGLVVVALASGWALWASVGDRGIVTFVFVAVSWVITLCLHEFAHAFVAYRNGDESVVHRGYLTLDPLKYTHLVLSLVLPLIFLLLGGIGLPGGAVFIDRRALRTRFAHSAVSAAGPLTNLVVAIVLCTAIFAARVGGASNNNLWAALAFLAFLQVTATVLNLLPVPGLDGYGIIEPYLPAAWAGRAASIAPYVFYGFLILLLVPAVNQAFFGGIYGLLGLLGVPPILIETGRSLFQFWF